MKKPPQWGGAAASPGYSSWPRPRLPPFWAADFSRDHPIFPPRKRGMMRLYQGTHRAYFGGDLHARTMFLCILAHDGRTLLHEDIPATKDDFLKAIAPHRDGLVVACERMFAWYWLADACAAEGIPFVLSRSAELF